MNEEKITHPDWNLLIRYGKIKAPFSHFTALAEGRMMKEENDFRCPVGLAWMAMKTWATDADESANMIRIIGGQVGFEITGEIHVYETEPKEPPRENPFGYEIGFTPFQNNGG